MHTRSTGRSGGTRRNYWALKACVCIAWPKCQKQTGRHPLASFDRKGENGFESLLIVDDLDVYRGVGRPKKHLGRNNV